MKNINYGKRSNFNDLEGLLTGSMGIRGIRNRLINKCVDYYGNRIKNHFGITMEFPSDMHTAVFTEWLRKYDKGFMHHISNPYAVSDKHSKVMPIIESDFLVKLDAHTFIYVSGENESVGQDRTSNRVSIYLFGKHFPKYYKELKNLLNNRLRSDNMIYSICGKGGNNDRNYWTCSGSKLTRRTMDTLYFDNNIKEQIMTHLDKWMDNEALYESRGLIFKTGILLYGTSGTGKSSLAAAIAYYLGCSIISIDCTTFDHLDLGEVTDCINADDERYVVLLDEIDAVFVSRDGDGAGTDKAKNTSKLLSFLDSPNSPKNVVFIGTTNYVDRMDEAALRKGRFDLSIELTNISQNSALEMCHGFGLDAENTEELMETTEFPVNPSKFQSLILERMGDGDANKEDLEEDPEDTEALVKKSEKLVKDFADLVDRSINSDEDEDDYDEEEDYE